MRSISRAPMNCPSRSFSCCVMRRLKGMLRPSSQWKVSTPRPTTTLRRSASMFNIEALRRSVVVGLGVETFHWLLGRSIPFNRLITQQLNERLGQFIGAREIDRMTDTDARVARSLAALFHPVLYPGVGNLLRI